MIRTHGWLHTKCAQSELHIKKTELIGGALLWAQQPPCGLRGGGLTHTGCAPYEAYNAAPVATRNAFVGSQSSPLLPEEAVPSFIGSSVPDIRKDPRAPQYPSCSKNRASISPLLQ